MWCSCPRAMTFTAGGGEFSAGSSAAADPGVQIFLLKDALPGKALEFTVSGNGACRARIRAHRAAADRHGRAGQRAAPEQRSRTAARRRHRHTHQHARSAEQIQVVDSGRNGAAAGGCGGIPAAQAGGSACRALVADSARRCSGYAAPLPAAKNSALLNALKEELFALESEKIAGTLAPGSTPSKRRRWRRC